MAQIDHRHPTLMLYVAHDSLTTHWISIVLAEKAIMPNVIVVDPKEMPAALKRINPHGVLPILMDQERLILHTPTIISEYLEERFPHPPLLPIYPITRAKCRQVVYQIEQDWYKLLQQIEAGQSADKARQLLQRNLLNLAPLFDVKLYFLGDEFTLVDCCIAPILWRLKQLNIDLLGEKASMQAYQARLFGQASFKDSLRRINQDVN
jgi:stringent starvation protein A